MKFSSLAALEVVIWATSGAASVENFVKMTTFSFQCCALSWSFAHLPHMGLPMGQKLVKFATNLVQTLRIAYL